MKKLILYLKRKIYKNKSAKIGEHLVYIKPGKIKRVYLTTVYEYEYDNDK